MSRTLNMDVFDTLSIEPHRAAHENDFGLHDIRTVLRYADHAYYLQGAPVMEDATYDIILDLYRSRRKAIGEAVDAEIGFPLAEPCTEAVDLPVAIGGTRKLKIGQPQLAENITKWAKVYGTHGVTITEKLDGASGVYSNISGKHTLQTRQGVPITRLLPFMGLPLLPEGHAVRGELIMPTDDFDMYYRKTFCHPRTTVTGQFRAQEGKLDPTVVKRTHFVAFEYLMSGPGTPSTTQLSHSEQLTRLRSLGFRVVSGNRVETDVPLTPALLSSHLYNARLFGDYKVDGVVVTADSALNARDDIDNLGCPRYTFAFKEDATGVVVTVTAVRWQTGRTGRICPVLSFDPVDIGVMVSSATAANARFVANNNIGPGSRVRIARGGDVVPQVKEVLTQSATGEPQMPTFPYEWDGAYIVVPSGMPNINMEKGRLTHFVKVAGIKGVSASFVSRAYDAGIITSIDDLLAVSPQSLPVGAVKGIGAKTIEKVVEGIRRARASFDLATLAYASGKIPVTFGRRTLRKAIRACADVMCDAGTAPANLTASAPGIGSVRSVVLEKAWPLFWKWLNSTLTAEEIARIVAQAKGMAVGQVTVGEITTKGQVAGVSERVPVRDPMLAYVLFTGFRDAALSEMLGAASVARAFSGRVTAVVTPDGIVNNTKTRKAAAAGVPVLCRSQLREMLGMGGELDGNNGKRKRCAE